MQIGINFGVEADSVPTKLLGRLAAAGFDALDVDLTGLFGSMDWTDTKAMGSYLDKLAGAAADAGLTFCQTHAPMNINILDQVSPDKTRAQMSVALDASHRLGADWMVMHPGMCAGTFDTSHQNQMRDGNVAFFQSLLDRCDRTGVGIAIENLADTTRDTSRRGLRVICATAAELCELVDAVDHPLVGACWDTGHGRRMHLDQRVSIASLGVRCKVIHANESGGVHDDHLLPYSCGSGGPNWTPKGIDWKDVAAGLRDAGFGGTFSYEVGGHLNALPDEMLDIFLRHAVAVARQIVAWIEQ